MSQSADKVRQLFDAKAATWAAKYAPGGRLTGRVCQFAAALSQNVAAGGHVLDLGCGTGDLASTLSDAGWPVTACDISDQMLRRAAGRDQAGAVEWVLLSPDWRTLPFESASFDAIVAASVLEYVDDPAAVLRECARALRPGGLVLCTVPNIAHPLRSLEWLARQVSHLPQVRTAVHSSPVFGGYLTYLQTSRHRHPAGWWCAAAASAGLLANPCPRRAPDRSPLRLFTFYRPDETGPSAGSMTDSTQRFAPDASQDEGEPHNLTKASSADDNKCSVQGPVQRRLRPLAPVKPGITVFTRSYPPAYLRGGPARSLHALVEALAADFSFSVVTSASDDPATGPMQSIQPSRWSTFGHAMIWYESKHRMPARTAAKRLRETQPRLVYLNSLFDYRFAILPLLIVRMLFWKVPVVLAPRGELSAGALAFKHYKKRAFIAAFRLLKLHQAVTWHASTSHEKADIERAFGPKVRTHIAIDLRTGPSRRRG